MTEGMHTMIGASKILTVSYGTFSCTLEGFDDPFNTMRAIAEYFRNLAAEDRYFGAEPPTPDAAMLHRIAEREINRRVEANIQENGVILRAGEIEPSKPHQPMAAPAVAPAAIASGEAQHATLAPAADDSIAARLVRLREAQAVAEQAAAEQPEADVQVLTEDENETEAHKAPGAPMLQADIWEASSTEDAAEDTAQDTIASIMADLAEAAPIGPDLDQPAAVEDAAPRVRAETAPDASPLPDAPELSSWPLVDDVALAAPDGFDPDPGADRAEDAGTGQTDTAAGHEAAPQTDQRGDDAILRATLGRMIDPEGDDDSDDEVARGDGDSPVAAGPVPSAAPTVAAETEDVTAATAPEAASSDPDDEAPIMIAAAPDDESPEDAPATAVAEPGPQADTGAADRLQRARARVIKIRRIDTGFATAAPAQEPEVQAATADSTIGRDVPASALSPEAEAELQRELADLEADLAPAAEPARPAAQPLAAAEPHRPAEPLRPAEPPPADDAVNRLISQTNAAMEGPENKRRLAAIAHLKAAVAATFADRKSNTAPAQPGPAERQDPYREDLDRVVRPRRPAPTTPGVQDAATAPRPQNDARPAPLVLVSEQRIDRPAAAAPKPLVTPVRPRRVTTDFVTPAPRKPDAEIDDEADTGSLTPDDVNNIFADPTQPFAEFAERLGAVKLPDLMEAAAAYCALQLGRDQFTRPLLLQQIAALSGGENFNREDCLRSFGTLLRDGRIEKIKRGQFRLSGKSRYLAEARRLAG